MTKVNPYEIVKQAGISPGTATLLALGAGGGLGYLWDKINTLRGKKPESSIRNPLLGATLAGLPVWLLGLARNSYAFDKNGNPVMSLKDRWFTDDETFYNHPIVHQNVKDRMQDRVKYYKWKPIEVQVSYKEMEKPAEWVDTIGSIPVNAFNETTWVDASRGRTPMEAAGFVTNTLNQTGKRVGSNFVTPGQVINTMVNAGIGYGTAWLAGKTLGALAGVSPATQKKLCEIGTWGGVLGGISNAANNYY